MDSSYRTWKTAHDTGMPALARGASQCGKGKGLRAAQLVADPPIAPPRHADACAVLLQLLRAIDHAHADRNASDGPLARATAKPERICLAAHRAPERVSEILRPHSGSGARASCPTMASKSRTVRPCSARRSTMPEAEKRPKRADRRARESHLVLAKCDRALAHPHPGPQRPRRVVVLVGERQRADRNFQLAKRCSRLG